MWREARRFPAPEDQLLRLAAQACTARFYLTEQRTEGLTQPIDFIATINPAIKMVGLIVRHREVPSLAKPARAREITDDSHNVASIYRATH
jgi:hypothetical protein